MTEGKKPFSITGSGLGFGVMVAYFPDYETAKQKLIDAGKGEYLATLQETTKEAAVEYGCVITHGSFGKDYSHIVDKNNATTRAFHEAMKVLNSPAPSR